MTVNYKGLIPDHLNPIDIAKTLSETYGGDGGLFNYGVLFTNEDGFYYVTFRENATEEQKAMRPRDRAEIIRKRSMAVFTDGSCASDYATVTTKPMTYLSLGHSGDCREIIDSLVRRLGGYVYDELGPKEICEKWVTLDVAEAARAKEIK